ncbi:MAG: twin-arginine translocation signal domain-containing protein, partial [Thermus sp.]
MARYVSWLDFRRQAEAKGGLSRRDFLRLTGAGGALMALGSLPAQAQQAQRRIHVKSDAKLFIPASA